MKFITLEQLLALHVIAIGVGGGSNGLRDLGRLEAAVAAQSQFVFGEELYPTLFDKAGALCRGIIADHPFTDGNKRTAMLSALTFIELNGYKFAAKPGELEDFAVKIATDKLSVGQVAAWFKTHAKPA